jgi:2-amino-4-hydroxy-6-hydroxymethyldihydropteridine diphosphokinase
VAFGLGANLGDAVAALQGAVDRLGPLLVDPVVSHVYDTAPIGGPEQPEYVNAVLIGFTDVSAPELLKASHQAEQEWNRVRDVRWGPRTLDVDVLDVEGVVSDDPHLTLPHPRAVERAFVLIPWLEIEPAAVLANGARLAAQTAVLEQADREGLVRMRSDVELVMPQ